MERYWDADEKTRAKWTAERVQSFLAAELMEQGVIAPKEPELAKVPIVQVPTKRWYCVKKKESYSETNVAIFHTTSAAETFIALCPYEREYDYQTKTAYAKPYGSLVIEPEDLPSPEDYALYKSKAQQAATAKEANDKLLDEHRKLVEAVDKTTESIWSDWREQRRKLERCKAVRQTWLDYMTICKDDNEAASTFLAKAYNAEEIVLAKEWLGMSAMVVEQEEKEEDE